MYVSSLTAQRLQSQSQSQRLMQGRLNTLEELVNDGGIKYGFVDGGSTSQFLQVISKHIKEISIEGFQNFEIFLKFQLLKEYEEPIVQEDLRECDGLENYGWE
jgi:ABC-type Zn uptake system ZnuABC Zn-binding protein ZnuA